MASYLSKNLHKSEKKIPQHRQEALNLSKRLKSGNLVIKNITQRKIS